MAGRWIDGPIVRDLVDVVVLAGDRGPGDPLAQAAGVRGKALVPAAGRSLMTRVLDAVSGWPQLGRLVLVAPDHADYRGAAALAEPAPRQLHWLTPQQSLSASVRVGLAATKTPAMLLLTADHALMDRAWLDALWRAAERHRQATVLVGVTDWNAVMARFPGSRRTRYRFSDRSICGTNLFVLRTPGVEHLLEVWQGIEQQRKRPWRIVSLLGWANLAAYLAGRLSLDAAFEALSRRVGIEIVPVLLDDPLTAVDVDTLADLELVKSVLAGKNRTAC